ncbi:hypothetical protein BJX63DRAFT_420886 [Aspergillus granulosus]|uniref:Thioredoxin domain-containing protein n=1 Tax=Aspergillus granulosus TaxID=176169 RepID=A0ABR4HHT7_9EURO
MAEERAAPLRLGSVAPNFETETSNGPINFHDYIGNSWAILFSHPDDFTPICTTELGAFAKLEPEFTARGVKLIGLSANGTESHKAWIKDIDEVTGSKLTFPIISDPERKIAYQYDMVDYQDTTNVDSKGMALTIRSVFIIDPSKKIRLIMTYPASTGRNTAEVLRVVDALQTTDKHGVTCPINWLPGDDVVIPPPVSTEDAQKKFGDIRIVKPDEHPPSGISPGAQAGNSSSNPVNLSGLVCNVRRTSGREPPALVGATTTILGDKLYVFGGRILSKTRPHLTSDIFELDLIRRHWSRIEATGDIPRPRYFHSVCALGDNKLVCYGGMSPITNASQDAANGGPAGHEPQPEVVVMSDIHIFDVPTRTWTRVNTHDSPQGRYAHCATIIPSSAYFTSATAPLSAIHHNPASANPHQGSIGVDIDGFGGAEMVVVGGQDSTNHYIEQISVFNLRSLKWTNTSPLGRSCGAYRSVAAPLTGMTVSDIGSAAAEADAQEPIEGPGATGCPMLIYSNYNFLDVKLELQLRLSDGRLIEKAMPSQASPPGLRFPNGGVINGHFVVSGTYLTSSKQEYALWALDLKSLTWGRIDAGGSVFGQGSWNRGVLWARRNTFVILGHRKRNLVDDYNHRRINFTHLCMVELEAFGLYNNPCRISPTSGYISHSAPSVPASFHHKLAQLTSGGRPFSAASDELGRIAQIPEMADMELQAVGGERIPVNSRILSRRWGPYFIQLLRESSDTTSDAATLRSALAPYPSRNSSITITPSLDHGSTYSNATTLASNSQNPSKSLLANLELPSAHSLPPTSRPRVLYLPHTVLTLQVLVYYLYTSSLPPVGSPLCTPQILCSLLQLARPYQVDGLLEAIVERLHQVLDGRNAAAVFNAAAMAAGGGRGTGFISGPGGTLEALNGVHAANELANSTASLALHDNRLNSDSSDTEHGPTSSVSVASSSAGGASMGSRGVPLRINTNVFNRRQQRSDRDDSISNASTSSASATSFDNSDSEPLSAGPTRATRRRRGTHEREVWTGDLSSVIGLQKRGLRGLMEGRRLRERSAKPPSSGQVSAATIAVDPPLAQ